MVLYTIIIISIGLNLWYYYCQMNHTSISKFSMSSTDQYAYRIWKRTNHQGHFDKHAPVSEVSYILCLLSLLLACDFGLFRIITFPFYFRWPNGVFHLQPWLCDLFVCGVLLPSIYCHSPGLHPHLRLPQDEAEEDLFRSAQWKGSARLNPTICGEAIILILLPSIFLYGTTF